MTFQMNRVLTEQDYQEISKFEISANDSGWDFVTQDGGVKNSMVVLQYLEQNPTVPCTHNELVRFLNANTSLFVSRTPMQRKYDAVVKTSGRSAAELDTFHKLMLTAGAKNRVDTQGDNYFYNASLLLAQLQGRVVDYPNFIAAIGRLAPGSAGSKFAPTERLIFVPEHYVAIDPRRGVHAVDPNHKPGRFIEDFNQTDTQRFLAKREEPQQTQATTREEDHYRRENDKIVANGSWGQRAALEEVRKTALVNSGGSEKIANSLLLQAYRSIFKRNYQSLVPFEEIARAGRR